MNEMLVTSAFFCTALTLGAYMLGNWLKQRFHNPLLSPMVLAIVFVIVTLLLLGIDYDSYSKATMGISFLVTPATVCLAIPLYRQLALLRHNWLAILGGIFAGVLASLLTVFAVAMVFRLDAAQYATMLPRSITTAIGMEVSRELGGSATITMIAIMVTGVVGNMLAELVLRLLRVTNPIAMGVAIGSSCHVLGTAKAIEMGETQGAMSSLAIVVAGLLTVVLAPLFAAFL